MDDWDTAAGREASETISLVLLVQVVSLDRAEAAKPEQGGFRAPRCDLVKSTLQFASCKNAAQTRSPNFGLDAIPFVPSAALQKQTTAL